MSETKDKVTTPAPTKPHVNNLAMRALDFCCGAVELGNFNYVDPPGGKEMKHFHKVGSWKANPNEASDPTTKEDIERRLADNYSSCVIATTGAGQEYVEPILASLGFVHTFTFVNPDHADTPVKLWARATKPFTESGTK